MIYVVHIIFKALPAAQLLIQQNQMYFANQRDPTVTKLVKTFNTK